MVAYYNEIDPYAAEWLRNLIATGHIAPGYVDERSIEDVKPYDLREFTQCHFFAGVGVWSYALRRAGWPDNRPVWTGSCPCQPFSAAGKGAGFDDERHLWPAWFHLITQQEPGVVFGEQVASKPGLAWLDLIQIDLEGAGYASGAVDLCAAGVGAPHLRQRSWFAAERMADSDSAGCGIIGRRGVHSPGETGPHVNDVLEAGGLADSKSLGGGAGLCDIGSAGLGRNQPCDSCSSGGPADSSRIGREWRERPSEGCEHDRENARRIESDDGLIGIDEISDGHGQPGPTNGIWRAADWLYCRDGKWRPVRPGSFPLVNGAPSRVGRLRAYGNAINTETATEFIRAYLKVRP